MVTGKSLPPLGNRDDAEFVGRDWFVLTEYPRKLLAEQPALNECYIERLADSLYYERG